MYIHQFPSNNFVVHLLYVGVMLIIRQDTNMISELKKELFKSFDKKDLGLTTQILGIGITQDRKNKKQWFTKRNMLNGCLKSST